mgnify:CR=1 FL=1
MVVYIAYSEPEAYIIVGRLQTEGIPAFVQQEAIGKVYGFAGGPLGDVRVLVNAQDYDRAQAILDDTEDFDESDDEYSDDLDLAPDDDDE